MPRSTDHLFRINHSRGFRCAVFLVNGFIVLLLRPFFFLFYGFRVFGRKNLRAAKKGIIVSNHSLNMDAYFVGTRTWPRINWYAVESNNILRRDVGWLNRLNGAFGIRDTYPMSIAASVKKAMTRNEYVTIFPEGRQEFRNQRVMPFNKGGFYLALESGVPIIPAAFVLYGRTFGKHSAWIPPRVHMHILPAIETEGLVRPGVSLRKASNDLAEQTRKVIQETIDEKGGHKDLVIEPLLK